MLKYFASLRIKFIVVLIAVGLCGQLQLPTPAAAAAPQRRAHQKVVVVDPGHGGHADGVTGPSGALEKAIVLEFSQRLQRHLEHRYRVHLTRTADYALDNYQRTDMANHLRADLFISLHTASSARLQSGGIEIFYFQPQPSPALKSTAGNGSMTASTWNGLQEKHRSASRRLAQTLETRLEADLSGKKCHIHTAPLLVLRGLDMPAVLVEIGYLSNPADEKNLQDPRHLDALAKAIERSIDEYFRNEK